MKDRSATVITISGLCLALLLAAGNAGELIRLYKTHRSIRHYREAAERIPSVPERQLSDLRDRLTALEQNPSGAEDQADAPRPAGETVRSLLRHHVIQVERLRISGKGSDETAEFALRCNPVQFFSFLAEVQNSSSVNISSISIKPSAGSSLADITLRVKNGSGIAGKKPPEQRGLADPRILARSFHPPRPAEKPVPADIPGRTEDESPPPLPPSKPLENQVTFLGIIRDSDNAEWLYVKERESGRILRIGTGTDSEGENRLISAAADHYVVQIGETQFIAGRTHP
ncbi:MAG: hypothetical protein LBD78_10270 [Spirochaetaceae bacterium]|jgi:hypothetical protein|nr:hypothetical protein [Spirochaetaceae bacterium]